MQKCLNQYKYFLFGYSELVNYLAKEESMNFLKVIMNEKILKLQILIIKVKG